MFSFNQHLLEAANNRQTSFEQTLKTNIQIRQRLYTIPKISPTHLRVNKYAFHADRSKCKTCIILNRMHELLIQIHIIFIEINLRS